MAKKSSGKTNSKKMEISAIAVVDNIVFSKTDAVAYFKLSNSVFDFLSNEQQTALGLRINNALNNLMGDKQEPIEGQIIITNVPVDIDAWEAQVRSVASTWEQSPGFEEYINQQIRHLRYQEFNKRVCYLAVNLGKRGALDMSGLNVFESGFKGAQETLNLWLNSILKSPTEVISAQEEELYKKHETGYFTTLSVGHLKAQRCTAEEILLLIKRQFYPAMETPYLDVDSGNRLGPGDLALELGSVIRNKYRWLKISQMFGEHEMTGYRACMTMAKFPKESYYPNGPFPFLYYPAKLGAPFTIYSRFTLHPSVKMKVEVEKKRKEQKDELENITTGQDQYDSAVSGLPADIVQAMEDSQLISELISDDKTPWVEGSYHIVVEATSEEKLKEYCAKLKQAYDDLGILLQWTAGDQAELFLEQMPGDRVRIKSFSQITNLAMLSTSGMNFSSDVGDLIFGTDSRE